jgi:hypothetical protein
MGGGRVEGGVGHVLSADQRRVATVLWRDIQASGTITPASYARMQAAHLKIGDVMPPGLYQAEFTPQGSSASTGPNVYYSARGTKHSQFVYIDASGDSHIPSSGPDNTPRNNLDVLTGSFDENGPHSLGTVIGARNEEIFVYIVRNSTKWKIDDL